VKKRRCLLACGRYIERNPLRAKIVDEPDSYDYRSVRYYINNIEDSITTQNPYFESFGNSMSKPIHKKDGIYPGEGVE
jgi:hypothetical protein